MENLTLSAQELARLKRGFYWVGLIATAAWSAIQYFGFEASFTVGKAIGWGSFGLSTTMLIFWVFYNWLWRIGPIPKWLGRPVLEGIWLGELSSEYRRAPEEPPQTIRIAFVIRQTYLTLSIQSLTENQVGESKVEAILHNPRTRKYRLAYVFELKNEYPGARTLVNGAGDLELENNNLVLRGSYWTSSPSHGNLILKQVTNKLGDTPRFDDLLTRWPASVWRVS